VSGEGTQPAPAVTEEVVETPKVRGGWLKSIADGRFHEVEDIQLVLQAYPGQYEECKASEVKKNLVGWPKADGSNEV